MRGTLSARAVARNKRWTEGQELENAPTGRLVAMKYSSVRRPGEEVGNKGLENCLVARLVAVEVGEAGAKGKRQSGGQINLTDWWPG